MGSIEEGFCRDDSDCSQKQYCYHVSRQCVNYTLCSRYNRAENNKPARSASQCGLCLPNYSAEELGTGEFSHICKKVNLSDEIVPYGNVYSSPWFIGGIISGLSILVFVVACAIFFKQRGKKSTKNKLELCADFHTMEPSAPVETSPFLGLKKDLSHVSFNNNEILKDKNRLVHASAFNHPSWVTCDPNYENNLNNNNDNMNALEQFNSTSITSDNPNELVPIQTMQGDNRAHVENNANAALVQRNNFNSSNATGDDIPQDNHNSNGSTSGANNTQDGRERAQSSNILIAQINVNVLNHDC